MTNIDSSADIHARLAMAEAALRSIGQHIAPEMRHLDTAVLIPCENAATTIADVVKSFRIALPHARVFVYDNNSHDNSAAIAREAGAIVRREPLQGRHNVIRRMFLDIEADVYVLASADGAHDAAAAPRMISRMIETQADMVVGGRVTADKKAFRTERRPGDRTLARMTARILGDRFNDILSGYRVFSRRYVKSFPARSTHIDCELAFSAHALELGMITAEVQTACAEQALDSMPRRKPLLEALRNGVAIARLMRDHRPHTLFGALAVLVGVGGTMAGYPVIAAGVAIVALCTGAAIGAVNAGRREFKRLALNGQESLAARLERYSETRVSLDSLRAQALAENTLREMPAPRRARVN